MKNYELKVKWVEECEGKVIIEANSVEEAKEMLNSNHEFYAQLAKNLYKGYRSSSTLKDTEYISEEEHQIEEVEYVTIWDGATVKTSAKYNSTNGEIFDIGDKDNIIKEPCKLKSEYVISSKGEKLHILHTDDKVVTRDYLVARIEESAAVHGAENISLSRSDDHCFIVYGDTHTAFNCEDVEYRFASENDWYSISEYIEMLGFNVEEE